MAIKITRREFLLALAAMAGTAGLAGCKQLLETPQPAPTVTPIPPATLVPTPSPTAPAIGTTTSSMPAPTIAAAPTQSSLIQTSASSLASLVGKVVHVQNSQATFWDFKSGYFGDYVRQNMVNAMVDQGVQKLTGASSVAQAWKTLIPDYAPGKAIAIKVNFNNSWKCVAAGNVIDALIHPINALVNGLVQAYPNLAFRDVWVYDATQGPNPANDGRAITDRFKKGLDARFAGVQFFDPACNKGISYSSTAASAQVTWHHPAGVPTPPATRVADVLVNAAYVINMPILKRHGGSGVSLAFKNHLGSIPNADPFHIKYLWNSDYNLTNYNVLVDIYRNPNIQYKTVLTLADGLFGNRNDNTSEPTPWKTFGNRAPNSLLFATDPVATDCVMCDLLSKETPGGTMKKEDYYLVYAAQMGLGTYERGDPWATSGYQKIKYQKVGLG